MSRHRGSVLLLVLWAVAALSVLAIAQATRMSLQMKWAKRLDEICQARYLAWTAAEIAGQELTSDAEPVWDAPKEPWGSVPADPISFASGWLRYRIQDEQSRIPLNRAPAEIIARLPGFTFQTADELIARRAAGKPVTHLGELLLLNGFQKEALQGLPDLVTVYATGPVNINTAPAPVLRQIGFSASMADRVASFRLGQDGKWGTQDDGVFPEAEQILPILESRFGPLLPEDQAVIGSLISSRLLGVRSAFFQVEAEGWTQAGGIHAKATAVLERADLHARPILRGWHEI